MDRFSPLLRALGVLGMGASLASCASPPPARAPRLDPPPAEDRALSRSGVVTTARKATTSDAAIEALDRYPFAFELSEALPWFEIQGLDPEVLDYLQKRARVDWESLRGDIGGQGPRDFPEQTR